MKIAAMILKGLIFAVFAFSSYGKLTQNPDVVAGFTHFGFGTHLIRPIGMMELVSAIVFVVPTSIDFLGAILITGYMGGAIVTHLRVGQPPLVQELIPILTWTAYFLGRPEIAKSIFVSKSNK